MSTVYGPRGKSSEYGWVGPIAEPAADPAVDAWVFALFARPISVEEYETQSGASLASVTPPGRSEPVDDDAPLYPRRTIAERHAAVIELLVRRPEISDRRAARIAVVSRELVSKIRRDMIRLSRIESRHALHRVGSDGKVYKSLPRAKEARP